MNAWKRDMWGSRGGVNIVVFSNVTLFSVVER
jgi:hypothetical protein